MCYMGHTGKRFAPKPKGGDLGQILVLGYLAGGKTLAKNRKILNLSAQNRASSVPVSKGLAAIKSLRIGR